MPPPMAARVQELPRTQNPVLADESPNLTGQGDEGYKINYAKQTDEQPTCQHIACSACCLCLSRAAHGNQGIPNFRLLFVRIQVSAPRTVHQLPFTVPARLGKIVARSREAKKGRSPLHPEP